LHLTVCSSGTVTIYLEAVDVQVGVVEAVDLQRDTLADDGGLSTCAGCLLGVASVFGWLQAASTKKLPSSRPQHTALGALLVWWRPADPVTNSRPWGGRASRVEHFIRGSSTRPACTGTGLNPQTPAPRVIAIFSEGYMLSTHASSNPFERVMGGSGGEAGPRASGGRAWTARARGSRARRCP
jgi:hypothetical protein